MPVECEWCVIAGAVPVRVFRVVEVPACRVCGFVAAVSAELEVHVCSGTWPSSGVRGERA